MSELETWKALYETDFQAVYALWLVPGLWAAWRIASPVSPEGAIAPRDEAFIRSWTTLFLMETMLDPWATGPLLRMLGIAGTTVGTAVMVGFVLAGDFRVLWLMLHLSRREGGAVRSAAAAGAVTLVVPVVAALVTGGLTALWPRLPRQTIWLVYEIGFAVLALALRAVILPRRIDRPVSPLSRYLSAMAGFVAVYYLLWASADVVILALGLDIGWGIRMIPNQLYYAFTVPIAYELFFRGAPIGPDPALVAVGARS